VFDGHYITGDVDARYLERIDVLRNDKAQSRQRGEQESDGVVVGLHNDVSP
jgi:amidophosphoribosyltransferase